MTTFKCELLRPQSVRDAIHSTTIKFRNSDTYNELAKVNKDAMFSFVICQNKKWLKIITNGVYAFRIGPLWVIVNHLT